MSKTPFMPLWVSDFLGDTLDLDATEVGAYMLILMAQWNRSGKSLPADKLKRIARVGRNWPKVWGELERYFKTDSDGVYSKRLRLEAHNVDMKRRVNAQSGALGGKAKALKSNKPPLANATETLKRNPSIPEPEPYKERESNDSLVHSFNSFWEIWPKKISKQSALKAWKKLSLNERREAYAKCVGWFSSWQAAYPDASPIHPATFLNQKRWQDDLLPAKSKGRTNGHDRMEAGQRAAERFTREKRQRELDSGQGDNASQPLLSAGPALRVIGSSDDGLA